MEADSYGVMDPRFQIELRNFSNKLKFFLYVQ